MNSITSRYLSIYDEINSLADRRTWQTRKIKLIVVTKKQSIDRCLEVIEAGATDLGENYAEEAVKKFDLTLPKRISVHMIGHLQSRKVKLLYPLFSCIQTLDSIEISEKINRFYENTNEAIDALIEINLSDQEGKSGFKLRNKIEEIEFEKNFQRILLCRKVRIKGLMTMGDFPYNRDTNRFIFRRMKNILEGLKEKYNLEEFNELSMGTSGDYQTAIEEGATMVRIGEKIMGAREL